MNTLRAPCIVEGFLPMIPVKKVRAGAFGRNEMSNKPPIRKSSPQRRPLPDLAMFAPPTASLSAEMFPALDS